jgi:hypothetical protein
MKNYLSSILRYLFNIIRFKLFFKPNTRNRNIRQNESMRRKIEFENLFKSDIDTRIKSLDLIIFHRHPETIKIE